MLSARINSQLMAAAQGRAVIWALALIGLSLAGCKSVPKEEVPSPSGDVIPPPIVEEAHEEESALLTCMFAGDIMAHNVNYRMKDYSRIWDGIRGEVSSCDLAFANIEMPVDDDIPMSTYPEFNVHSPYVEAAIDAGFNVFSLVNNHTNDQGLRGMDATRKWAERRAAQSEVYFSGLKESALDPMSYAVIEKNGFRVLFLAVTEILNRADYKRNMNYIGTDDASRSSFIDIIKALRSNNPCDIFVLSIHANVMEYVHEIGQARAEWYKRLLAAGVDVVWANHPHIVQDAVLADDKLVLFACGNTISGQRSAPQFNSPSTERDWTGDGLMMRVVFKKSSAESAASYVIESAQPLFITTYITAAGEYVVRMLDDKTIEQLNEEGKGKWARYLAARKNIMACVPMASKESQRNKIEDSK